MKGFEYGFARRVAIRFGTNSSRLQNGVRRAQATSQKEGFHHAGRSGVDCFAGVFNEFGVSEYQDCLVGVINVIGGSWSDVNGADAVLE